MRPPSPRQIPIVVLVRVETTVPGRLGAGRTYTNTLYRASIQTMGAAARQVYGLIGSIRALHLLFPRDPGVYAGDLILVPPVLRADPPDPEIGALWVNSTEGTVRWNSGTSIVTLTTVKSIYSTPLNVVGPAVTDIGGGLGFVVVVLGSAEDSTHLGLQFRVDAAESA